jgi:hypothetical protein
MAEFIDDDVFLQGRKLGATASNTIAISAAGSTTITMPSGVSFLYLTINFTGSNYTHDVILDAGSSTTGDAIQILASLPAGSNITVNYVDGVASATNLTLVADPLINPLPVNWFIRTGTWDWKVGGAMPYQKVVWATTEQELRDYIGVTALLAPLQEFLAKQQMGKLTATVRNTSNSVNINLTGGLSVNVVNGSSYCCTWKLIYQSVATTTGITVGINGISGATGTLVSKIDVGGFGADGAAGSFQGALNTLGTDVVTTTGTVVINTSYIITIDAIFTATASGQIVPFFRSEINGSQVSILSNSNFTAMLL